MIISLLGKGGSGKTTMATSLAHVYQTRGLRTLLVDADPQTSTSDWHRASEGSVLQVIGSNSRTIERDVKMLRDRYDVIFIDTGKFDESEKILTESTKIVVASDVVLIPVTPSPYDVWAAKALVDLTKQRIIITEGKFRAAMVVSRRMVGTNIGNDVKDALAEYELPVFDGTAHRVAYVESAAKGHTVIHTKDELARNEVNKLADELAIFCEIPNAIAYENKAC